LFILDGYILFSEITEQSSYFRKAFMDTLQLSLKLVEEKYAARNFRLNYIANDEDSYICFMLAAGKPAQSLKPQIFLQRKMNKF
jgi:hypothetical protein